MTDAIEFPFNAPIGRTEKGEPIYPDRQFFQVLNQLRDRALGGSAQPVAPTRTFYQATEPTNWRDGDIWYDIDDGQRRVYRRVLGAAEVIADRTNFNASAGLLAGATITLDAGGSPLAAGQPATQQIADGDVLTWGPYGATPTLFIDPSPLPALAAGESYELAITGASASGGTASLKKRTAGGVLTAQTGSTRTVNNTDPGEVEIQKPTVADAYNAIYSFALTGFIEGFLVVDPEGILPERITGNMTVEVYYRATFGGPYVLAGTTTITATADGVNALTRTISISGFPAIGQHADFEFKVLCSARTYTGSRITDVTQISYTTIAGGATSTATPSSTPKLTLRIDPV